MRQDEQTKIDQKRDQMLNCPVSELICKMSVPTIISMLVTAFYNLADTFFVGRLNSNSATGAVGLVFSLMAIIQACGYFFGHGSGNYISRAIGQREYEKAAEIAATGFFSAIFVGIIFAVVGLIFRTPVAFLLGATDTMLADTVAYMTYILIGAPWMMAAFVLNNQLRLEGNSLFSMIGLVSGAVSNIALDPLMIFTLHMGVAGAALATIISQFISFVVLLIGCQKSSNISIRWRNFTPKKNYYLEIAGGGLPSLCRQGLASIATLLLNHCARVYGDAAIAAFAVFTKIINISGAAILGFGQGFQPVCGFNYGAKKYDRVRKAVWFSVSVAAVFMVVISVFLYFFSESAIGLFRDDPAVIEIGAAALRYQCMVLPLLGWVIIMNMYLQNIRKTLSATILAISRQGLIFIPVLLTLSAVLGLKGLEFAQPTSDFLTFLIAIPLGITALKELHTKEWR